MDYTMWIPTTSNSDEPPQEDDNHQPPSSSLSSLPNDVVLSCLVRIPRIYDLNVSRVSKSLKSLVRSRELDRLRSLFQKDSLYLCFRDNNMSPHCHWFSFCQNETKTDIDYQLVPVPFPSHPFMLYSSTVMVGSYIYFIGGPLYRSKNLLILDTVSGQVRVGPSMKVARYARKTVVEVVDGKIYVIGGCDEEIQVEVFDPESQKWEFATKEKMRCISGFSASLEGKVYVVEEDGKVCIQSERRSKKGDINKKEEKTRRDNRDTAKW